MKNSISKVFYNNIDILNYSDKAIVYFRLQNYNRALKYFSKLIDSVVLFFNDIGVNKFYFSENSELVEEAYINGILTSILQAQENRDYVLLADLLELQLTPFILKLQEIIVTKEEVPFNIQQYIDNIELIGRKNPALKEQLKQMDYPYHLEQKGYFVEYTASGLLTLALQDLDKKYYMHSNGQVLKEAAVLAREWFSDDISEYIIYGLGLGYHITELMELDESITIHVFESDIHVIQIACAYSHMKKILSSDRVTITYDPQFTELDLKTRYVSDDVKYVIHAPSLRNIRNLKARQELEDYFISYSSINNQLHSLNNNYRKNIKHYDAYVDVLKDKFQGKDLYIVAAGPSLDNNYLRLKERKGNSVILATGTVLKKLLKAGIKPDYVIMIDANDLVYPQIDGLENEEIPLLFLSTTYYKIPENYKGYKYLICQEGFKKAEEYAKNMGYGLYQTGGSVSTTALDIGIQLGCKKIVFIGLDLAYTNEKDHASGIPVVTMPISEELRQVEDIHGNLVATGKNLDMYRKWIENRIKDVTNIEFIDATEGGARIKGMKIKSLREVVDSY